MQCCWSPRWRKGPQLKECRQLLEAGEDREPILSEHQLYLPPMSVP